MQFDPNTKISRAISPADGGAATTNIDGAILDMSGYQGVAAVVTMGAITATAVTSLRFLQGDAANMSDGTLLVAPVVTIPDDGDNQTFVADLRNATKRYVRVRVVRGTANAVVTGGTYLQYGAAKAPVTNGANVTSASAVSPAEA